MAFNIIVCAKQVPYSKLPGVLWLWMVKGEEQVNIHSATPFPSN